MTVLTRLRDIQRRILKAQRRLWLLQASLWVTLALAGASLVGGAAWWLRRRRAGSPDPSPAASREPVNPSTNGQLTTTASGGVH